jgi:altered-inheritance-of-mitochondria protein 13
MALEESPQLTPQTDSTRTANLELKIQSRVASELERIAAEEKAKLVAATEATTAEQPPKESRPSFLGVVAEESEEERRKAKLSRVAVSKEVQDLQEKLAKRKKQEQMDPVVEAARNNLVQCLRLNDRRPLNCWDEKEEFKKAVGRLEKEFVERTIR